MKENKKWSSILKDKCYNDGEINDSIE